MEIFSQRFEKHNGGTIKVTIKFLIFKSSNLHSQVLFPDKRRYLVTKNDNLVIIKKNFNTEI